MIYKIKKINNTLVEHLIHFFNSDPFFAKLIASKNFSLFEAIKLFKLETAIVPYSELTNISKAVSIIIDFIQANDTSTIWIWGDYDSDGATSVAILKHVLIAVTNVLNLNCSIKAYIPSRTEGYGINADWCRKLDTSLPQLVITVDNGTNAVEAVNILNQKGIPVIVTDHHMPEELIADCLIVNPHVHNDTKQLHLAGCGVAFKLGLALEDAVNLNVMQDVMDLLCIGTIGDMMPMTIENIAFCHYGLEIINSSACTPIIDLIKTVDTVTYKDISFDIVPKINSCGRMGRIDMLHDMFESPSEELAMAICELNEARKQKVDLLMPLASCQNSNIVTFCNENISGIGGIIAGKVSLERETDIVVLSLASDNETYVGSGRAFSSNILERLQSLQSQFKTLKASGHSEACGVRIHQSELNAFKEAFDFQLQQDSIQKGLVHFEEQVTYVDMQIDFEEIDVEKLSIVQSLPYDKNHLQTPLFATIANLIEKEPTKKNPANAWLTFGNGKKRMRVWAKDMTDKAMHLKKKNNLTIIFTLEKDFMNPKYETLQIVDILEHEIY